MAVAEQRQWQRQRQRGSLVVPAFFLTFFCFFSRRYTFFSSCFRKAPLFAKSPPIFDTRAQHPQLSMHARGVGMKGGRRAGELLLVCASANKNKRSEWQMAANE